MSLSDCEHCWDTPCVCGWGYRDWSEKGRISLAAAILGIKIPELTRIVGGGVPEKHPLLHDNNWTRRE